MSDIIQATEREIGCGKITILGTKKFRWGLVFAIPFLIGAVCLYSSLAVNQAIWNNQHITNYTASITTLALPRPAVSVQVVVENTKVADEKLLQCEVGQPEYAFNNCTALTTYYYAPGGQFTYTIDDLFEEAHSCTEQTKIAVAKCGWPYQTGFTGFSSYTEMYDLQKACSQSLQSSDVMCFVDYDTEYGFPKHIVGSIPNVLDGVWVIQVKDFHVDD